MVPGRVFRLLLLMCLVVLSFRIEGAAGAGAERRVALIIGNARYVSAGELDNPPNDARLLAKVLQDAGFELIGGKPLIDLDRPATERAIRSFGQKLRGGSVGLFYYSGHGVQIGGNNYIVPVTASLSSEADVKYELIDVNFVMDEMVHAGNRLNMIILDACRNNPFSTRGTRSVKSGLAQIQAPAGTLISYATQPGNVAADGEGNNSPFAEALAKSFRQPGRNVFEVFNNVGVAVKRATGGEQQPWLATSPIEGDFYFFTASAPNAASAPPASAPAAAPVPAAPAEPPKPPPAPANPGTSGSGGHRIDVQAIPYLPAAAKQELSRRYVGAPGPKALAVGDQGFYSYRTNQNGHLTAEDARRMALESCQYLNEGACLLYAVDDELAFAPNTKPRPTPVEIVGSGSFDPDRVPFVSNEVRRGKMRQYANADGHKALAIHHTGAWATSWNKDSIEEAEERALAGCANYRQDGCVIYALDDDVVLDEGVDEGVDEVDATEEPKGPKVKVKR